MISAHARLCFHIRALLYAVVPSRNYFAPFHKSQKHLLVVLETLEGVDTPPVPVGCLSRCCWGSRFKPERWLETNADFIKLERSEAGRPGPDLTSAQDVPQWELGERGFVRRFMPFSYGR
jgi:hypothetical protein